ncbi:hypothetical protein ACFL2O_09355 [Thermodesulfobacteriota bacterium]
MTSFAEIPFAFNTKQLFEYLRIEPDTDRAKAFEDLVGKVREVGKPKALYKESFIDKKGEDTITLDGITFKSLALRKNLDSIERVFPYVATCGTEIDDIEVGKGDLQKKMWISVLKENLLQASMHFLGENLAERYRVSNLSSMNPGSGDASVWPFEQQRKLFEICGDVESLIGVKLTKSLVLVPDMSLVGIFFPTEVDFQSCQLCHREKCRLRRAPFDRELWESINQN